MKSTLLVIGFFAAVTELSIIDACNKGRAIHESLEDLTYWAHKVNYETQKLSLELDLSDAAISRLKSQPSPRPSQCDVQTNDAVLYHDENGKPFSKTNP